MIATRSSKNSLPEEDEWAMAGKGGKIVKPVSTSSLNDKGAKEKSEKQIAKSPVPQKAVRPILKKSAEPSPNDVIMASISKRQEALKAAVPPTSRLIAIKSGESRDGLESAASRDSQVEPISRINPISPMKWESPSIESTSPRNEGRGTSPPPPPLSPPPRRNSFRYQLFPEGPGTLPTIADTKLECAARTWVGGSIYNYVKNMAPPRDVKEDPIVPDKKEEARGNLYSSKLKSKSDAEQKESKKTDDEEAEAKKTKELPDDQAPRVCRPKFRHSQ